MKNHIVCIDPFWSISNCFFLCYLYILPLIMQHEAAHVKKLVLVDRYQSFRMSAPEIY